MTLNMDGTSVWTVTGTCSVNALYMEEGAVVTVPAGYTLTAYADGKEISLQAGDYEALDLVVTKDGETVYEGIYALPEEAEAETAEETTSDEANNNAASGEQGGGSGEQGGSGEMQNGNGEGPGGGAAGVCVHDPVITGIDLQCDDTLDVSLTGAAAQITPTAAGDYTLTCTLTLSDGSTQTETLRLSVR